MLNKKKALGVFIFLLVLVGCESREEREYLDSLGLKLRGVIQFMDTPDDFNGFSVMNVSVLSSNISHYDQRETRETYYCVIIGNKAQLYPGDIRNCNIGDTIEVDSKERLFRVYKKTGEVLENEMIFYTNEQFYRYVRKHYRDF